MITFFDEQKTVWNNEIFSSIFFITSTLSLTHLSSRSPSKPDWSDFNGLNISSNSNIFEYPFLNSGTVHAKKSTEKIFAFSRGFGGKVLRVDSILSILILILSSLTIFEYKALRNTSENNTCVITLGLNRDKINRTF